MEASLPPLTSGYGTARSLDKTKQRKHLVDARTLQCVGSEPTNGSSREMAVDIRPPHRRIEARSSVRRVGAVRRHYRIALARHNVRPAGPGSCGVCLTGTAAQPRDQVQMRPGYGPFPRTGNHFDRRRCTPRRPPPFPASPEVAIRSPRNGERATARFPTGLRKDRERSEMASDSVPVPNVDERSGPAFSTLRFATVVYISCVQ